MSGKESENKATRDNDDSKKDRNGNKNENDNDGSNVEESEAKANDDNNDKNDIENGNAKNEADNKTENKTKKKTEKKTDSKNKNKHKHKHEDEDEDEDKDKDKDKDKDEDENANRIEERGWVRFIIIGEDKYNRLMIKANDTVDKIQKLEAIVEEKGTSKNIATEGNRLMKELHVLERQLELQQQVIEQKKDDELQQEKVEKRQRRKLKKEKDNNVIPETKLAKRQRQENWKKAKKNHTVIEYMNYFELTTDQSNEIHSLTLWCYYDYHGNTTRMSDNTRQGRKEENKTPVTITPAKASL